MKVKDKVAALCATANEKFLSQFGFYLQDASFSKLKDYMYKPKDSSSLAVTRILFGLAMLFDISDERGGARMDQQWGNPRTCHFPLVPFVQAIPMPHMAIVYAALWLGAMGIMFGYKYHISATMFSACYWYLFLIEKSFWNNHSYLFGLVAILLTCTEANCYWSIDARRDPSKLKTTVPYWNYFILKYQFFILYFMAGMKKGTAEWLTGYSLQNLSKHWVFGPFKLFLTVAQTDFFIVHLFVFVFDLTIAIWMMYSKTRHVAMVFCALFHLMNSRIFSIGMFPWVCLATMPLFYPFDWPKVLLGKFEFYQTKIKAQICRNIRNIKTCAADKAIECKLTAEEKNECCNDLEPTDDGTKNNQEVEESTEEDDVFDDNTEVIKEPQEVSAADNRNKKDNTDYYFNRKSLTLNLIIFYVFIQAFMPYSHFITKGYNNWTNGLYGYSWDMMVHTFDTHAVLIKVVDNDNDAEFYVDPEAYAPNDRWTRHGDMVYQYARCLKEQLLTEARHSRQNVISENISIYVDVWCSLNGRFTQRLWDSKADILKVDWSPFTPSSYVMPLLDEALAWRTKLDAMRKQYTRSNDEVVFLAEFPGYEQEKYISSHLKNVTLKILKGVVVYVEKVQSLSPFKLSAGEHIRLDIGSFHKVLNPGATPAYYMYTYTNITKEKIPKNTKISSKLPIARELARRFNKIYVFGKLLLKNVVESVFCLTNCCTSI